MLKGLTERQERIMEVILVVGLAVVPSFINALFAYLGYISTDLSKNNFNAVYILQIINQITVLLVLFYVLYRQGRGLRYIGFSFSWKDIFEGLGLLIAALLFTYIISIIVAIISYLLGAEVNNIPKNVELFNMGPLNLLFLIVLIVNSFYEELIVRAFFITEVSDLTGNMALTAVLCVIIQTSYHIYQGLMPLLNIAGIFIVFTFYYIKRRRIMPVILAHTYMNIISALAARYMDTLV